MNKLLIILLLLTGLDVYSQKQTFDITTFTLSAGWKKQKTDQVLQLSKENKSTGAFCVIKIYKAIDAANNSKENFDAAWESLVKETLNIEAAPVMQPSANEDGWEVQTGSAGFEMDSTKGVAMLVAATGYDKLVNILVLTNSGTYEKELTSFFGSISCKRPVQSKTAVVNKPQTTPPPVQQSSKGGFAFTTTNFDDGWTSTVQEDWVEVTKGNIKVLLHYPKEGTVFPADPEPLTNAAWNILVAPRYSNLTNYKTAYISSYNRPYLGMGNATEIATGKNVFVLLFRQGQGWLEFITPDKNAFIEQFKFDPETIRWDSETDLLKPLLNMSTYNRFAVAASDFTGKWTSDFTGIQQLYNVYTGSYAGMNIHQSSEEFVFGAGGAYSWKLLAVNGMVGNMKIDQVKSSGTLTVPDNWHIHCSKIESRAKTYHAFWSCIKGARILNLLDKDYPGSNIYTQYGLAK